MPILAQIDKNFDAVHGGLTNSLHAIKMAIGGTVLTPPDVSH